MALSSTISETVRMPAPSRRALVTGGGAALILGLSGVALPRPARASTGTLFGYREKRFDSIKPFIKWTGTLDRYFAERKLEDAPCESGWFNRCYLQDWKRFLGKLPSKGVMTQLDAINRYMNRAPYIVDPVNYGVPDYWATPKQFFVKDGDCEDYGIAKYLSMRALRHPTDVMRIVVLMDMNLKIAHAVLAYYLDDEIYILDNQINTVVPHHRIRHYRPIYSINEKYYWVHTA